MSLSVTDLKADSATVALVTGDAALADWPRSLFWALPMAAPTQTLVLSGLPSVTHSGGWQLKQI